MPERTYDLEERLLDYAAQVVRLIERLPGKRRVAYHGKKQ